MMNNVIRPTGEPAGAPVQGLKSPTHRILVADDEAVLRQLMTAALVGDGYHVDAAEDGAIAWEALQAKPYDLLITDQNMPKITGVELVKNLRSARMALPVVMVAGMLPMDELAREPSVRFAATLLKPFAVEALLDTVENVLHATASPCAQINPLSNWHWNGQPSADGLWL